MRYVARLSVNVDPSIATVVVDCVPVQRGSGGLLVLNVGDYVLENAALTRRATTRTETEELELAAISSHLD
jgi:hypothetical protein